MNEKKLLDAAISMLAGWCDAVDRHGADWDSWDEHYKDARYRPGPLRDLIDAKMAEIKRDEDAIDARHQLDHENT